MHTQSHIEDLDAELDAMFAAVAVTHAAPGDQASRLRGLMDRANEAPPSPPPQKPVPVADVRPSITKPHAIERTAGSARVIAVASGKGGVGKTNIAVNLAIALAKQGLRVTLLDADLGTANADLLCGVVPHARLDHLLAPAGLGVHDGARRSIRDIAIACPGGFTLIPGSAGVARMADLTPGERRWLLNALIELAADADVLLIDSAAGIGPDVTGMLAAADLALVVTTPEPTAMADAYALIKCLASTDREAIEERAQLGVVVNQTRSTAEAFATHARLAQVCDRFLAMSVPMLGFVAHDVRVGEAVRAQSPLLVRTPSSPAAHNVQELSGAVINLLGLHPRKSRSAASNSPTPGGLKRLVRRLLGDSSSNRTTGRFSHESARAH